MTVVAVGSATESNALITPAFSATNARPSAANRTVTGRVSPLNTVDSRK
jgi:hypothetical protein